MASLKKLSTQTGTCFSPDCSGAYSFYSVRKYLINPLHLLILGSALISPASVWAKTVSKGERFTQDTTPILSKNTDPDCLKQMVTAPFINPCETDISSLNNLQSTTGFSTQLDRTSFHGSMTSHFLGGLGGIGGIFGGATAMAGPLALAATVGGLATVFTGGNGSSSDGNNNSTSSPGTDDTPCVNSILNPCDDGGGETPDNDPGQGGADLGSPTFWATLPEYLLNRPAFDLIGLADFFAASWNLAEPWQHGGGGEIIAILDTGVSSHDDLDNILPCTGDCPYYSNGDPHGHGTHVAGIAAADKDGAGILGVAYNASILPICANVGGGCQDDFTITTGDLFEWSALMGASVANMSYGIPFYEVDQNGIETGHSRGWVASDTSSNYADPRLKSTTLLLFGEAGSNSFQQAKTALELGLIPVVAAGNHTYGNYSSVPGKTDQPGVLGMARTIYNNTSLEEDLTDQFLVVGNATDDGSIAPSSHACGDAYLDCILAPGTVIFSTVPGESYAEATGTSMAAPFVSGTVANLLALYPTAVLSGGHEYAYLCDAGDPRYNQVQCNAKAIVVRIKVTATDVGSPGPDRVNGHGVINLYQAIQPIGVAQLSTATGERYSIEDSQLSLSSTMGTRLASTLSSIYFIATDSFDQAGFIYQGSSLLGTEQEINKTINTQDYLARSLRPAPTSIAINGGQLALTQQFKPSTQPGQPDKNQEASYRLNYAINKQHALEFTTDFDLNDFGLTTAPKLGIAQLSVSSAFNSPYSQFNEQVQGIKYQLSLAQGYRFETGFFQGSLNEADESQTQNQSLDTSSMIMQLSSPFQKGLFGGELQSSIQFGLLEEKRSVLGSHGTGPWDFENGSDSWITGISLDYQLIPDTHLLMSYFYSRTDSEQSQGLLQNNSALLSNSFSLGLLKNHSDSFQYGLFVSQPLRLSSGQATLQLPTGYQGYQLAYTDLDVDLSPQGRHLEYEFAISWKPDYLDYVRLNFLRIEDYGNIPGNNDSMLLFSAGVKF